MFKKTLGAIGGAVGGGALGAKLGAWTGIGLCIVCPPAGAVIAPALIANGLFFGAALGGLKGVAKPLEGMVSGGTVMLPLPKAPQS